MKKLVIFDLDGVLVESRDIHYNTLNQALDFYGYPIIEYEAHIKYFNGLPTKVKLEKLELPKDERDKVWRLKQFLTGEAASDFKFDPKINKLLQNLIAEECILAVASNAIYSTATKILDQLGIRYLFSKIATADNYPPKPSQEMYLGILNELDISPDDKVLIIEDSPIGLEAAAKTGCKILRVSGPWDLNLEQILRILDKGY